MRLKRDLDSNRSVAITILALSLMAASVSLRAEVGQDTGTDLNFHKFQPKVAPEKAPSVAAQIPSPNGMSFGAAQQIQALQQQKDSRTPPQWRIDAHLRDA